MSKEGKEGKKEKHVSLWTQKFGCKEIVDEKQLWNTVEYIQNNRAKHGLAVVDGLDAVVEGMCCSFDEAFGVEWSGGFDVVIGNPPYVNFANLPEYLRNYFKKNSNVCKNKTDLYACFIEKSVDILKEKGMFSYIIPHTWVSTTSFLPLRKLIFENYRIEKLVELEHGVFKDAVVKTAILVCEKSKLFNGVPIYNDQFDLVVNIPKAIILKDEEHVINFDWNPKKQQIEDKMFKDSQRLDKLIRFTRGIKTSNDKRFLYFEKKNEEYKKVLRGRNIKAYRIDYEGEYIWYRPDLMKEKVGCLPHTKKLFEVDEKLITQRVNSSGQLLVTYDNEQHYCLDTTNVSIINKNVNINIKYLLAIMNSRLINWWFNDKFKMPTISGYELHQIPIKYLKEYENTFNDYANYKLKNKKEAQQPFINKADKMLELNKNLQGKINNFIKYLQSQYAIEKLSTKLQHWYELDFGDFIKELNKAIKAKGKENSKGTCPLVKKEEMEWMELFEEKKAEVVALQVEIDKTDREIDLMVYELYGLTEEEIRIVEGV